MPKVEALCDELALMPAPSAPASRSGFLRRGERGSTGVVGSVFLGGSLIDRSSPPMRVKPFLVLACGLFVLAGCGDAGSPVSATPAATPADGASTAPSPSRSASSEPLPDGYDPTRNPKADIVAALKKAKLDGRPVLLDFGADWCPDCVVLGRTFRTKTVRPVIAGYHVVSIDVGQFDRNLGVARKYGLDLQRSGIPGLVVLSSSGKVKTRTNDGSFASARTMKPAQVAAFLKRWR
ncbi:thioredoxin family protein [Actinomadura monticuli]|uniref:Thioredoxin family protein n=1 Tax=Actinomadura monticuli TaxID=3097367 RepID=A0ABV4Q4W6_9ACTN